MFKLSYWEIYYIDVVRGKKRGVLPAALRFLLLIASWPFQLIVNMRNMAYDWGWVCSYSPPVPLVISVGNIVAGGTGKTPTTHALAKEFYEDYLIAILSRGYRSKAEHLPAPLWLSKGQGPMHPAEYCGDEPYLLSSNLPKALAFVGKDRHKASNMAARAGAQLILLDDGMQHRALARDLEVIVVDARDPLGQGYFLPRGFLREGISSLSRADLIVVNHVQDAEEFAKMKELMGKYSEAPVVGMRLGVDGVYNLRDQLQEPLQGKAVGFFCAIAHPDYFEKTLRDEGAAIVGRHVMGDHEKFHPKVLEKFALECKNAGASLLVCTEKDKVKLKEADNLALPIVWLKTHLVIQEGNSQWEQFINEAKSILNRRV